MSRITVDSVEDGAGGAKEMACENSVDSNTLSSFLFEPFNASFLKAMLMEFLATCLFLVSISEPWGKPLMVLNTHQSIPTTSLIHPAFYT